MIQVITTKFKSIGRLRYEPIMPGQRAVEPNWLILECDDELTRYYRYWVWKRMFVKTTRPAWGSHVSLIRNEHIYKRDCWKKHNGAKVEFEYIPFVHDNGRHFWLKCFCKQFQDIREELGLLKQPPVPFHLTVGCAVE